MQITVRFFALVRERAGVPQTDLVLEPGASVAGAIETIGKQFPGLATLLPRIGCAVNQAYVDRTQRLCEGDELALIPPVSGG
jgi:molybdopterin converting factor subunit 1